MSGSSRRSSLLIRPRRRGSPSSFRTLIVRIHSFIPRHDGRLVTHSPRGGPRSSDACFSRRPERVGGRRSRPCFGRTERPRPTDVGLPHPPAGASQARPTLVATSLLSVSVASVVVAHSPQFAEGFG